MYSYSEDEMRFEGQSEVKRHCPRCGAVNGKDFFGWVGGLCPACDSEDQYELNKIEGVR